MVAFAVRSSGAQSEVNFGVRLVNSAALSMTGYASAVVYRA